MSGFQKFANAQPAPAEAGDFAGSNPRMSTSGGPGSYTAAANIPATFGEAVPSIPAFVVGRFAWAEPNSGDVNNTQGTQGEAPASVAHNYFTLLSLLGFVHRENQAIIVPFLKEYEFAVQAGLPANLMSKGDFWAEFDGGAVAGQKVYADSLTGVATADVTGQSLTTTFTLALVHATGIMTVTSVSAATLAVGQVVTGAGVPKGTYITAQLTGSAGSNGTYQMNQSAAGNLSAVPATAYGKIETPWSVTTTAFADATSTASSLAVTGILTIGATIAGVFAPGQLITGANFPAGSRIVRQLSGSTGGAGTYQTNVFKLITSEAIVGSQGKVAKISQWQTA